MVNKTSALNKAEQLKENISNRYNPQPISSMDYVEAKEFSCRQAKKAAKAMSLNSDEEKRYAMSVFESICYFNKRDERHHEIMRYRAECLEAEE